MSIPVNKHSKAWVQAVGRTIAFGAMAAVAAILAPSSAFAQDAPAKRPSEILFGQYFEPKKVTYTQASDFGLAAATCAKAIGTDKLDVSKIDTTQWRAIPLDEATAKDNIVFESATQPVKIFLSTSFEPKGQCVIDGYGKSKGEFGKIASEVKKQVGTAIGKKLKDTGSGESPGGFSRGQGFRADDFMVAISSENRAEGMSIRITQMRMDPSKSPYAIANAAAMAAQFLPMILESKPAKTATPAEKQVPQNPKPAPK